MLIKFYKLVWIIFTGIFGIAMLSGIGVGWTLVTLGMISFGLIFMGMMFILPFSITHSPDVTKPEIVNTKHRIEENLGAFGFRLRTTDVSMRQIKFR